MLILYLPESAPPMVFGVGLLPAARVGAGVVFRVLFMVSGKGSGSSAPCGKELMFAASAQGLKWTLSALV